MMVNANAAANFADNALLDANVPTGVMTSMARYSRGQRQAIVNAFSPRVLAGGPGLGNDPGCPDNAPYAVPGWPGRCSNVQSAPDGNLFPTNNPVLQTVSSPVYDTSITQQNSEARFGLQLTEDRATQERLAAEAQAQGAAQGYNVQCRIVVNESPAMGGLPATRYYQTICTVNGQDGYSAALLVRPGGWDQARTEAHLPASTYVPPVAQTPATTQTSTQQSQASGGGNTQVQTPQTQAQSQAQTQQWPSATYNVDPGAASPAPSASGAVSGLLSNPVALAAIAAVAFFAFKGK